VSSEVERFLEFLETQRDRQALRHPAGQVLSYMATTSRPGTYAQVSVHRLHGVETGGSAAELRVRLAGPLPLRPRPGECLTVHLTRPDLAQGYQLKSLPLSGAGEGALLEEEGAWLTVKGHHLFTVHHSPYTLRFFQQVPFEEVRALCAGVRHAVCAVGETANVSPRFVFHHEVRDGRLLLFHGDGLALKTWMNLRRNPLETRLVLDLEEGRGFALRGQVEEFTRDEHTLAWEKVVAGFAAGGWGLPSRWLRLTVDAIEPVEPIEGAAIPNGGASGLSNPLPSPTGAP
jgi:hypothetical protein